MAWCSGPGFTTSTAAPPRPVDEPHQRGIITELDDPDAGVSEGGCRTYGHILCGREKRGAFVLTVQHLHPRYVLWVSGLCQISPSNFHV